MLKTLIATVLLSSSVSVGGLQPKKAVNPYTSVVGGYCLKDEFDFDYFYENLNIPSGSLLEFATFTFDYNTDGYSIENSDIHISLFDDSLTPNSCYYYSVSSVTATYINNSLSLVFNYYNDGTEVLRFNRGSVNENFDLSTVTFTGTSQLFLTDTYKNLTLFFETERILSGNNALLFNALFTSSGNRYIDFYNGWYNFKPTYLLSYRFDLYGNFIVKNNYYNNLRISGLNSSEFYINRYDVALGEYYVDDFDLTGNGQLVGNVQMSALLPAHVKTCLNSMGYFQYVQDTSNTTFYEMILSIMDAPIYYLTSLFNFDMFGMNMFVAFTSILTLLIVLVVIRKVMAH